MPELVRSLQQSGKAGARIAREQLFDCGGSLWRGKDGIAPDDEERSRKVGKHLATHGNNVVEELQPFACGGDVSKQRAEQLPRAPLKSSWKILHVVRERLVVMPDDALHLSQSAMRRIRK